jgi:hypothetical protein
MRLPKNRRRRRGIALVVVTMMIALMLVLLLALLSAGTTENRMAHTESAALNAQFTTESAIAVALGQLGAATREEFDDGTPKPWTSQPGAIRVHGMDGQLQRLYKLYTAAEMITESTGDLVNDMPEDWSTRPAEFTDMNTPKRDGTTGALHFPVLDPRLMTADKNSSVEGFQYTGHLAPRGVVGPMAGDDAQRLPMPVRWVYMLQDGTLGTVDAAGRFQSAGGSRASRENPITSRFAFWVDDESCKINLNTAGEGAFWDTPYADTAQERSLAKQQPTRLEYHRQPGHPAGVCLSSVLFPNRRYHPAEFISQKTAGGLLMNPMTYEDARDLWRMGRLVAAEFDDNTSAGGTKTPELFTQDTTPARVMPKDRQGRYLLASELLFDNSDPSHYPDTWGYRAMPGRRSTHSFFLRHPEARVNLARASGVLTTSSAAPEETLYGTPRIAMWAAHASTPAPGDEVANTIEGLERRYTPYDMKIALAATIGGQRYFVQRSEAGDGARDFEVNGSGQNKKIFQYLQRLTDRPVPGFLRPEADYTTFAEKYGADANDGDRDNILLSMLDYLRAANFADGHLQRFNQFSVLCPGEHQAYHGFGQVAALQTTLRGAAQQGTSDRPKGMGRVMSVSEVALLINCRAEVDENRVIKGQPSTANKSRLRNPGDRELEVSLLVEGFVPSAGWPDYRPFVSIALVGGAQGAAPRLGGSSWPQIKINDQTLAAPSAAAIMMAVEGNQVTGWKGSGGTTGVRGLMQGKLSFQPLFVPAQGGFPTKQRLRFSGGSGGVNQFKLAVYDTDSISATNLDSSAGDLTQVVPLVFPDITLDTMPMPSLPQDGTAVTFALRQTAAASGGRLVSDSDVVQSLVPLHSDYRLIAGRRWAHSGSGTSAMPVFTAHPRYGQQRFAHSLMDRTIPNSARVQEPMSLIPGLSSSYETSADFPLSLAGQSGVVSFFMNNRWQYRSFNDALEQMRKDGGKRGSVWPQDTGDFDNGPGNSPDGAFTNRPDDGNWQAYQSDRVPYFEAESTSQTGTAVPPVMDAAFSAQRLFPSPVMFGSLPTGVRANVPWQTLLFRPDLETDPMKRRYGIKTPPDHLLLDLFWSPVLEPSPVSTPFETQGKINVNHQIVPFSHIHRATALHAAMKAEALLAIPDTAAATYKAGPTQNEKFRHYIDAEETLQLWKRHVFDQGRVFLTPGEICEHPLVPESLAADEDDLRDFWNTHRLTGDNSKERPYARLYSRLTTRSNVYRIHFIAESLVKARSTPTDAFVAGKDRVTARQQGSCLATRRIDFRRTDIPNYLALPATGVAKPKSLSRFYEWKTGAIQRF